MATELPLISPHTIAVKDLEDLLKSGLVKKELDEHENETGKIIYFSKSGEGIYHLITSNPKFYVREDS